MSVMTLWRYYCKSWHFSPLDTFFSSLESNFIDGVIYNNTEQQQLYFVLHIDLHCIKNTIKYIESIKKGAHNNHWGLKR